jgi:hypothetical protein
MALGMMHDLQPPAAFKRRLRRLLQRWLAGRQPSPYGENEFSARPCAGTSCSGAASCEPDP